MISSSGRTGTTTDLDGNEIAIHSEDEIESFRHTDSTHVKAKANKHKRRRVEVEVTPKVYSEELDRQIDEDREALGKKPFDHDDKGHGDGTGEKTESITDPDSGMQCRDGKPDGFYYSDHRTVDSKNNIIVNTHAEPANINDIHDLPVLAHV